METERWQQLLALSRSYLSECMGWATEEDWRAAVAGVATALNQIGRYTEALGAAERCIGKVPNAFDCGMERGYALYKMDRLSEARDAYRAVTQMGALSDYEAKEQDYARKWVARIDRELAATAPAPPKQKQQHNTEPRGAGSGFFVTTAGYILTNAHVVEGCRQVIEGPNAAERSTTKPVFFPNLAVMRRDKDLDLAVLDGTHSSHRPNVSVSFRKGPLRLGEGIVAFGFPLPGLLSSEGNVSVGIVSALAGIADNPHKIQVSAPVQPGNSGGPLFDMSGRVIGIVVAKLDALRVARVTGDLPQQVNFAVKGADAIGFLRKAGIDVASAPAEQVMDVAAVAALAQQITVQLLCF